MCIRDRRKGWHSGEILVCLVVNGRKLPHAQELCAALIEQFPAIRSIVLNVNRQKTNVITGLENISLYGPDVYKRQSPNRARLSTPAWPRAAFPTLCWAT